jgi:hypothetical protein
MALEFFGAIFNEWAPKWWVVNDKQKPSLANGVIRIKKREIRESD